MVKSRPFRILPMPIELARRFSKRLDSVGVKHTLHLSEHEIEGAHYSWGLIQTERPLRLELQKQAVEMARRRRGSQVEIELIKGGHQLVFYHPPESEVAIPTSEMQLSDLSPQQRNQLQRDLEEKRRQRESIVESLAASSEQVRKLLGRRRRR